jgi:hypothetical protein
VILWASTVNFARTMVSRPSFDAAKRFCAIG